MMQKKKRWIHVGTCQILNMFLQQWVIWECKGEKLIKVDLKVFVLSNQKDVVTIIFLTTGKRVFGGEQRKGEK